MVLDSKCLNWTRYTKLERRLDADDLFRYHPADGTKIEEYNPFEVMDKMIVEFLNLGWAVVNEKHTIAMQENERFIKNYGHFTVPATKVDRVGEESPSLLSDAAEKMYLNFYELHKSMKDEKKPKRQPVHEFNTADVSARVELVDNKPTIVWQTPDLRAAVEVAYALLVSESIPRLKYCKHCGKAFWGNNPKTEFCSSQCRNQFNVYKSRRRKT